MPTSTVQIAPIAARAGNGGANGDGVYQTPARALPAGTYKSIQIFATFTDEAVDYVPGDEILGRIETSFDGGQTWDLQSQSDWKWGEKGKNGLYYTQINNLVVPANAFYRAWAKVLPTDGAAGAITFGVSATVTT